MSQQLTLELSDEAYADLQHKANAVGLSITEWIIEVLNGQNDAVSKISPSLDQQEQARQKLRSHAGVVRLGCPTGVDNQSIDADLARAYADEY